MTQQSPPVRQRVVPYLMYDDAKAAISFLIRAFGFRERECHLMPDGRVGHAELGFAEGSVMLASAWKEAAMASPRELPAVHGQVVVTVDDVDAHFARARDAGATVIAAPAEEHGFRFYRALDLEGHRWVFSGPMTGKGA